MKFRRVILSLWATICIGHQAMGQTAGMLSFQGFLKNANGEPMHGAVELSFRLFDRESDGALIADYGAIDANVNEGVVSIAFGPANPAHFDGSSRWLEVAVNGDPLPRLGWATAPAAAEQLNVPGTGNKAIEIDDQGNVGVNLLGANAGAKLRIRHIDDEEAEGALWSSVSTGFAGLFENGNPGWGGSAKLLWLKSANQNSDSFHLYVEGNDSPELVVRGNGRTGIGTSNPGALLDVAGDLVCGEVKFRSDPDNSFIRIEPNTLVMGGNQLAFKTGNQERFRVDGNGSVQFHHHVAVPVLEVRGGMDVAEPGRVSDAGLGEDAVKPGMVVSIDPVRPGSHILSTIAYDRKVSGVISGAGGVQPGLLMRQEGHAVSEGEHPIAMTGKVYAWADADANGAIHPGDLLTTSVTPGHAMRVNEDDCPPRGCIIGKAMTSLDAGTGLVLVLVQPQ